MVGVSYDYVIAKKRSFSIAVDISRTYLNTEIGTNRLSRSTGISLYPEYRFYPFNKKNRYPRGFYISPSISLGLYTGWDKYFRETGISVNYYSVTYSDEVRPGMDFTLATAGIGGAFGWQNFMGKRKQLTFTLSFAGYANKNFVLSETYPLSDKYRMYPKNKLSPGTYIAAYIGYAFGKLKKQSIK